MDCIVKITCCSCDCDFELRGKSIDAAGKLLCPNCHQAIPTDIFENLKVGMTALTNVPSVLDLEVESEYGWPSKNHLFMFEVLSHHQISKGAGDILMHIDDQSRS